MLSADVGVDEQTRFICQVLPWLLRGVVKQVAFVVSKMDAVGFSSSKYDQIVGDIKNLLRSTRGWPGKMVDSISMLPVAALHGDNSWKVHPKWDGRSKPCTVCLTVVTS